MSCYDTADYILIYVYAIHDDRHQGWLKVGRASLSSSLGISELTPNHPDLNRAARKRINGQTKTAFVEYDLLYTELATRVITLRDGSTQDKSFFDTDVHEVLDASGYESRNFLDSGRKSEWYQIDLPTAIAAIRAVKEGRSTIGTSLVPHATPKKKIVLRQEQEDCIARTIAMFLKYDSMLWDCKMRFGKTVTAYELIKQAKYQKTIVITHRPAVEDSWRSDLEHIFADTPYQFVDRRVGGDGMDAIMDAENERQLHNLLEEGTPFIYFASIQDLRGSKRVGGKFQKNNAVFDISWDLLIVDEAHEGTKTEKGDAVISALHRGNTKKLSLSGTPYNITGEYEEENRFTWTYVDEQKAKAKWEEDHPGEPNPYEELPKMNIFTFDISSKMPASYRYVTQDSAFNFHEFFRVWTGDLAKDYYPIPAGCHKGDFVHEEDVRRFLDLITLESQESNYPFSRKEFRDMFAHTFWLVPGVKEAKALSALLREHPVFSSYGIANIAGEGDEEQPYDEALSLVRSTIASYPKSITLSCGKLTTGITVREWTAIMMLAGSHTTSAAGYMQAIFRVQSPGSVGGKQKKNAYVFDFAPDRTLKVLAEVHRAVTGRKAQKTGRDEARAALGEFINFCPVIAYKDTQMNAYNVDEMMRQVKRISVESAIEKGFEDDSIYRSIDDLDLSEADADLLRRLSDVVSPRKKGQKQNEIILANLGMTEEKRKAAERAQRKPKKELTPEEKEALELRKKEKEEEKKLRDLLRAVSIRLPLLFYGADLDINQVVDLDYFVENVDPASWTEFMPSRLTKELFQSILKFYDLDVLVGAGMRIRQMAKAADELPPTLRAKEIVNLLAKFKNPDKETVLTPWRVVNMHLGEVFGGYNFYDEGYLTELEEPRFVDRGEVTADVFLGDQVKILEMNSKSGLYPLYMAYTLYMLQMNGKEKDLPLADTQAIWNKVVAQNIFVLCKTPMARLITIRTLVGYTGATVNAKYLPKLIEEWMKDIPRLARKLTNPTTWGIGGERMKFDCVVGNPPYQGNNHLQVYPYFYLTAREVASNYVSLIFPTGWQEPKNANNLSKLNNEEIKSDKQIICIDNRQNVFPGISGAEWVNIILWQRGYDNGLYGKQLIYTNGQKPEEIQLLWEAEAIPKPAEIMELLSCVTACGDYISLQANTSVLKPYGLRTDVFADPAKYHLNPMFQERENETDLVVYGLRQVRYVPFDYNLPKKTHRLNKYKVFVPYAWGNMSASAGLGGAYADIIVAKPFEICTETYLESGCFDDYNTAKKHAKYLLTKFARALLFVNKTSQHSTTAWGAIPVQDYTEEWWNKSIAEIDLELARKYNLPPHIAQFIQDSIQTKDESNIVNFE